MVFYNLLAMVLSLVGIGIVLGIALCSITMRCVYKPK